MRLIKIIFEVFSDEYIDDCGYKRFKSDDMLVHRFVKEKQLGRKLHPKEVVHHKDRNKANNSPDNLQVFDRNDHSKVHEPDPVKYGKL